MHSPDANLFYKILAAYPVGTISQILAFYRIHDGQQSKKMLSRVGEEAKFNIDSMVKLFPETSVTHKEAVEWAYDKVYFYNAIGFVQENNYQAARDSLLNIIKKSLYFRLFYLLVALRLPAKFILKLLSR